MGIGGSHRSALLGRAVAAAVLAVAWSLAPVAPGVADAVSSTWLPTPSISTPVGASETHINDVACPSAGQCVAVGYYVTSATASESYSSQPFMEVLSGGAWTLTMPSSAPSPPPSLPPSSISGVLNAVSCSDNTLASCVAVGDSVPQSQPDAGGDQLGFAEVSSDGVSWAATAAFAQPVQPAGAAVLAGQTLQGTVTLNGVSCTSDGACTAVGIGKYWTNPWPSGTKSPPSATFEQEPVAYSVTGDPGLDAWAPTIVYFHSSTDPAPSINTLQSVACQDATDCVAVGNYFGAQFGGPAPLIQHAYVATLTSSGWAETSPGSDPPGASEGAVLNSVSCPAATSCLAVGSYTDASGLVHGFTYTLAGAVWTADTSILASAGFVASQFNAVSCATITACMAVGSSTDGNSSSNLLETLGGSGWSASNAPPPTGFQNPALDGAACPPTATDASTCVAVGDGQPASGQPLAAPFSEILFVNAATSFQVSAPSPVQVGASVPVQVNALDSTGALALGYPGTVHITTSDPGATISADSTLSNGSGTFSVTFAATGSQTITATDTANGSITGSTTVSVQVFPTSQPRGLHVYANGGVATLTWSPPDSLGGGSVTSYEVLRSTVSGAEVALANAGLATSYVDTTAPRGIALYYEVEAVNGSGVSAPSTEVSVSLLASAGGGQRLAYTPDGGGYWLANAQGGVFAFGDARFFGSLAGSPLNQPIVSVASTPDGKGYWLAASDGGIFTFGDAGFYGSLGSLKLNKPIIGMSSRPDGLGYWLVASDGGIFSFGAAGFYGSLGAIHLNKPIVGMASTATSDGYWMVASDGGIFTFGDAGFYGSLGALKLNEPIVAMAPATFGAGYWLVAADGGIFTFGAAQYLGSLASQVILWPVLGIVVDPGDGGYSLIDEVGTSVHFGA